MTIIPSLLASPAFSDLEREFFRFLFEHNANHETALAGSILCNRISEGDTCIDLHAIAGAPIAEALQLDMPDEELQNKLPHYSQWIASLKSSSAVGQAGEEKPLILHNGRLYLYRYWRYEQKMAEKIQTLLAQEPPLFDENFLKKKLRHYFPDHSDGSINYQRLAALRALTHRFTVISGGPGTGKTSTVAKIIAILLEQFGESIDIVLAAPTGKAAARMRESIEMSLSERGMLSALPDSIKKIFPRDASTIHRLLGPISGSPYFHHNEENPLPCDVLVIDESSMVDLALMAKLFSAIPSRARVILLGDRDQLASVEAGSVLGDICGPRVEREGFSAQFAKLAKKIAGYTLPEEENIHHLRDAVIFLKKSYRFQEGIAELAKDINEGNSSAIAANLSSNAYGGISLLDIDKKSELLAKINELVEAGTWDFLASSDITTAMRRLFDLVILCAHRRGQWGSDTVGTLIEQAMKRRFGERSEWAGLYHGKPIMILKNNYELNLFNGDIGIVRRDPETSQLLALFPDTNPGTYRTINVFRLPEFTSAHAFSVHKSQGSEFKHVIFIIPPDLTPVLSRELLYTAVTRARESIQIWGRAEIFSRAVTRQVRRFSGLRSALWGQ